MLTPNVCCYLCVIGRINALRGALNWGPLRGFFCENVQYVDFPRNVEDLYSFEVDTFYDVVITEANVFNPLCSEVF